MNDAPLNDNVAATTILWQRVFAQTACDIQHAATKLWRSRFTYSTVAAGINTSVTNSIFINIYCTVVAYFYVTCFSVLF